MNAVKGIVALFLACGILSLYLFTGLLVPAYVTQIIFENGEWVAKTLIYLLCFLAICYGIKNYRIAERISRWYENTFGTKLFWE